MSSFNITNFTSITNDSKPKFTYKTRKDIQGNNEMLKANQQNEPILDIEKVASSNVKSQENTEKKNQGVPLPFILGHLISENELALATSYRKLNDVFDEFSELQQQNNKVSKKNEFKKFERNSDIGKRNQNRFTKESKNNRRNGKKRGGERKQKEIAERALKSKSINRGLLSRKAIVEAASSNKNHIQWNILKKNKEFIDDDEKMENHVSFNKNCNDEHENEIVYQKDIDSEQDNDSSEVEDWHEMLPILTSTPDNSTLVSQKMGEFVDSEASTNNEFHNDSSEEEDVIDAFTNSFPVHYEVGESTTPLALNKDYISIPPPKIDGVRRFILKPLSDDDDELF
ncbi:16871_t:CDS:2 [Funneliformis geosporum]|uniref:10579_t:CDS:1 n=1 Tax=Funneliformis geosporum TaxID=1117311 RepID=A0A9W4WVM4_9GLOM|nr:10579_t:CDS:2 [Funneliformis geosporum]CAI2186810.1 16871_t:CDS:2 [Funneliformis geosporum]